MPACRLDALPDGAEVLTGVTHGDIAPDDIPNVG
jgi:hypothetical protein